MEEGKKVSEESNDMPQGKTTVLKRTVNHDIIGEYMPEEIKAGRTVLHSLYAK